MSRAPLHVYRSPGGHVLLRGHWSPVLAEAGVRGLWSSPDRGWHVRAERMADLTALAEYRHSCVIVHGPS